LPAILVSDRGAGARTRKFCVTAQILRLQGEPMAAIPIAYLRAEAHEDDPTYSSSSTDSSLSFFSGHASMTGAIGATATYLAFARSPGTWRPWVTLTLATTVSALPSVYRVRGGKHFQTDVLVGTFAGVGIVSWCRTCTAAKTCSSVAFGLASLPRSTVVARRAAAA
jgi:membrane-associated phospholipid phosphatase